MLTDIVGPEFLAHADRVRAEERARKAAREARQGLTLAASAAPAESIEAVAAALAYTHAIHTLEAYCHQVEENVFDTTQLDIDEDDQATAQEARNEVRRAVAYLESRGLLLRDTLCTDYVCPLDESEEERPAPAAPEAEGGLVKFLAGVVTGAGTVVLLLAVGIGLLIWT